MNIELINDLKVEEYLELISLIGWKPLKKEQVETGIKHSMYTVKAVIDDKVVGMGRLIGDFGCHGMLTDIVVHPDYRHMGIGRKIVLSIKEYVNDYIKEGERFLIELCPTTGKRDFYLNCGFKYKPENMDGMYLWVDKTDL